MAGRSPGALLGCGYAVANETQETLVNIARFLTMNTGRKGVLAQESIAFIIHDF